MFLVSSIQCVVSDYCFALTGSSCTLSFAKHNNAAASPAATAGSFEGRIFVVTLLRSVLVLFATHKFGFHAAVVQIFLQRLLNL